MDVPDILLFILLAGVGVAFVVVNFGQDHTDVVKFAD